MCSQWHGQQAMSRYCRPPVLPRLPPLPDLMTMPASLAARPSAAILIRILVAAPIEAGWGRRPLDGVDRGDGGGA
ncbi:hypothetical protein E2562_003157 [Oryza meyeriana var. granulata]|uniref:Uncharacterized protein n=1 Tax=Oryza meyeriana var. granulata TaxID=110450 RepID=A0A6G1EUT7_9ORYZ|nr:hypothetical protein E2562_003157 [Oryza meyeriana var. granulata]